MPVHTATLGQVIALRAFTLGLAGLSMIWGVVVFPAFWFHSSIDRTASHIIDGDASKLETLIELIPALHVIEHAVPCRPIDAWSAAVIRLRLAEDVVAAAQRELIDVQLNSLRESIHRSLACAPANPFLWLILFWVDNTRTGFSLDNLKYLRMSYRLGPNEGWIAVKRNQVAFSLFDQLPPDLGEYAISEFVSLLKTGLYERAVEIFVGPAWRVRELILPRLKGVTQHDRQMFATMLYYGGYDVIVPGVKGRGSRPWQ